MAVLDTVAIFGHPRALRLRIRLDPLAAGIAISAAVLVMGAIVLRDFTENGFRLGSQLAWRYTSFVFFVALAAGPALRLVGRTLPTFVPPRNHDLRLVRGFCASYGIYLVSVFLPNVIRLSAGAVLMLLFGGTVALAMAATTAPVGRLVGGKTRRVVFGVAAVYFWLCYALMALARLSGPHRPDVFYDISLGLMIAVLLLCYADRWLARNTATPVKTAAV